MANAPKKRHEMPLTPLSRPRAGSTSNTGSWRTFRPAINLEKCTKCRICWIYCPDACIELNPDNVPKINYEYCKGCGICAHECPMKIIVMEREGGT
ncbi:MAG TPA: 4Fe-4S binding protein [Candidatus Bathyarchaeia archaeon]|nr:4Fe-4S binding protein [Candidatus Bathyarchaeia archaeon]